MKALFVAVAFAAILCALVYAGIFMVRGAKSGEARSHNMAWALAVRVGVSILLFTCLLLAYLMGWIQPTGLPLSH